MSGFILRPLIRRLSPPGRAARLSILIFHRVLPEPDPLFPDTPDARRFAQMLSWLDAWFDVLPLDAAVRALCAGSLPAGAAALTFDDGYADNVTTALPLLAARGLPATFFIATGYLDGRAMWNDVVIEAVRRCGAGVLDLEDLGLGAHALDGPASRRAAIDALIRQLKYLPGAEREERCARISKRVGGAPPSGLMMSPPQVRELRRAGMQIGAHTVSHPILANLERDRARSEIADSKAVLEALLDERVGLFAYPNGRPGDDYRDEHVALVREAGFDAAFSTVRGAAGPGSDLLQLPRFTPWDRGRARFGLRLAASLARPAPAP